MKWSSANAFNLGKSKILSPDKGLKFNKAKFYVILHGSQGFVVSFEHCKMHGNACYKM